MALHTYIHISENIRTVMNIDITYIISYVYLMHASVSTCDQYMYFSVA